MCYLSPSLTRTSGILVALMTCVVASSTLSQEPTAHGLHDLVIYDPGAHERGLPSPELVPSGDGLKVDIPPAVHIHRYYYSGDKEIQGPIINGGPTVVVANHPKTGQRMYVDVVLPAGAPRIAYSKHGISYVYPNKRVAVNFKHFPLNPQSVTVKVQHGRGVGRQLQDVHEHVSEHVKQGVSNSAFIQSGKEVVGEVCDFMNGVKVAAGDLGAKGLDGMKQLSNLVPGVTYLKSLSEQEVEKDYSNQIRAAAIGQERTEPRFVPTNR